MNALEIIAWIFTPVGIIGTLIGLAALIFGADKTNSERSQEASRDCEHVGHNWSTWKDGGGYSQTRHCIACGYIQRISQMGSR